MTGGGIPGNSADLRLLRQAALIVAAILLFDSASQLALALRPVEPWTALWRANAAQLTLTQITPVILAGLLTGLAAGAGGGQRLWAGALLLAGAVVLVIVARLVVETPHALEDAPLDRPDVFLRNATRGFVQGLVGGVGLLLAGVWGLRQGAASAEAQG